MSYIVVTGAAGFIGSCLISTLNQAGYDNIVAVDLFDNPEKNQNLLGKKIAQRIERTIFPEWLSINAPHVACIYHIGARTDTTEFNYRILEQLNLIYSQKLWQICAQNGIPLLYASSAATYGLGEYGYQDDEHIVYQLKPLNPYGESKNNFDKWAIEQAEKPPYWYGVKFFNVYGPNEYHKGRMASVIFHAYRQIYQTGSVKLFRSHNPHYRHGEQLRDFIYVKDAIAVCRFLMDNKPVSGLYNVGTGKARTFIDLATATFQAMGKEPHIEFIDTPEDIRDKYQYFTQAEISKLRAAGYTANFYTLETGIEEYVQAYLMKNCYF
ncbi:MAG: ADP-glyceromanno-heptose 6-epimerase [Cytophagales bacterium]|nr:ADP-glyceromanno-heptose 6-epimerase [Bernardetiaceae bacterium]MDW8203534.1 ADP-glyceromanno-heptose 6-epimerase [Cytophagales bacterium]